jgi:hypothetical protein
MGFNNKKAKALRKEALFRRSKRTFGGIRESITEPFVPLAQVIFEDLIDKGSLSISDGFRIINDPEAISKILKIAEAEFNEWKDAQVKLHEDKRLVAIANNTSTKNALKIAVGVSSFFFVTSTFMAPFISSMLQPTADELFKRTPIQIKEQIPVKQPDPASSGTTINNYYYFGKSAVPIRPSKKQKRKRHALRHQPR